MPKFGTLTSLLLLLAFCVGDAAAQPGTTINSSGLVVLNEEHRGRDFIRIYNADGSVWHEFSFYDELRASKVGVEKGSFLPFAFHPDYFLLALRCVRKEAGRYEVVVNEETGLKKYVRASDPSLKLEAWEQHVLGAFAVDFNPKENPPREAPRGRAKKADAKDALFQPVEMRGEWLKVKWRAADQPGRDDAPKYVYGWVRWRRSAILLLELFYFA